MPLKQQSLLIIGTLLAVIGSNSAFGQTNTTSGFLDFNVYPILDDVSNDSVFTLNILANFDSDVSYFGFINFDNEADASAGADTTSYYSEHHLRHKITDSAFDWTYQANFISGPNNDRHRLGVRWRLSDSQWLSSFFEWANLSYSITYHAINFDRVAGDTIQLEHAFQMRFPYWSDRLYLAGFIDHNFNLNIPNLRTDNPIVSEIQVGYQISSNLYAVYEWRLNDFRPSDVNNQALGLQYLARW